MRARLLLLLCLTGCQAGGGNPEADKPLPRAESAVDPRTGDLSLLEGAETKPAPARRSNQTRTETAQRRPRPGAAVGLLGDREMVERLRGRLSRSTRGLARERRRDGLRTIRFGERFSHVTLLRRMPDGSLRRTCVDNAQDAEAVLSSRPAGAYVTVQGR